MKDYLSLGCAPTDEDCAQVGSDDYGPRSRRECRAFVRALRKKFGPEPEGARICVKKFPHDFGSYREVVVEYDDDNEEALQYALKVEDDLPKTWAETGIKPEEDE